MATKEETELQKKIMLELSKYGIVIRQQSGTFQVVDNIDQVMKYGAKPKIRYIKCGFPGISDLQFIRDDGRLIVFMEVKTHRKGSKPSDEQENFINFINAKNSPNLKAVIVRSVEDALKSIGVDYAT